VWLLTTESYGESASTEQGVLKSGAPAP
jgi:hypothetical protein